MPEKKTIYLVAGLPRSGSTLLMNILGQNPRFYVTPTSGILDMLAQVRNAWDKNDANQARDRRENEMLKRNVLHNMLHGYFEHVDHPICFDKNRYWLEYLEMAAELLGEEPFQHDFDHVEQLTFEDDYAYGFKDLHKIRAKVEPQAPSWPKTFDDSVYGSPAWKTVERYASSWPREK